MPLLAEHYTLNKVFVSPEGVTEKLLREFEH